MRKKYIPEDQKKFKMIGVRPKTHEQIKINAKQKKLMVVDYMEKLIDEN